MALDYSFVSSLSDSELAGLAIVVFEESRQRKVESADTEALLDWGFSHLFSESGLPLTPQVVSGLLVVPGARWGGSLSHKCSFATAEGTWVWESRLKVGDQMRTIPGPRGLLQSVTVIAPIEGMGLDVVGCRARNGVHELTSVHSYAFESDVLNVVSARKVKAAEHR